MNNILVVDDVVMLLRATERAFNAEGISIIKAETAEKGLELFIAHRPLVIFSDVDTKSKMDGIQLAEEAYRIDSSVRTYIASGGMTQEQEHELRRLREAGIVKHFFAKPYNLFQVIWQIKSDTPQAL